MYLISNRAQYQYNASSLLRPRLCKNLKHHPPLFKHDVVCANISSTTEFQCFITDIVVVVVLYDNYFPFFNPASSKSDKSSTFFTTFFGLTTVAAGAEAAFNPSGSSGSNPARASKHTVGSSFFSGCLAVTCRYNNDVLALTMKVWRQTLHMNAA